ncbi:hypothetical protein [Hyphomonas sp.]|jgi:hypothetical protein|uniref:phage tail assembly chaperone n=1 Tax=Hyphomonas sp. TaxID=87 RepID=UPI0032D8F1F2
MKLKEALGKAVVDCLAGRPYNIPPGANVLWRAFSDLSSGRTMGPHGPNPINFTEIEAWARLMRVPLEPHHVEIIVEMDRKWVQDAYRDYSVPEGAKSLPRRSDHKLTPAMFDLALN